jgi:hypothetical protein
MHASVRPQPHGDVGMIRVQTVVSSVAKVAAGSSQFSDHVDRISHGRDISAPRRRPAKGSARFRRASRSSRTNPTPPFSTAADFHLYASRCNSPGRGFTYQELVARTVGNHRHPHASVRNKYSIGAGIALAARDATIVPTGSAGLVGPAVAPEMPRYDEVANSSPPGPARKHSRLILVEGHQL